MSLSERLYKYAYKQNNRKIAIKNLHSKCLYQKDSINMLTNRTIEKLPLKTYTVNVSIRKTLSINMLTNRTIEKLPLKTYRIKMSLSERLKTYP